MSTAGIRDFTASITTKTTLSIVAYLKTGYIGKLFLVDTTY